MKVTILPIVIGVFWYSKLKNWEIESWQTSGDHPNDSIIKNG